MTQLVRIDGHGGSVLASLSDDTAALLPAALARRRERTGDALTLLVPPGVPPEQTARDDGAVIAFVASGRWTEALAAWDDRPPVERCYLALSRALDGAQAAVALDVVDAARHEVSPPPRQAPVEAIVPHRGNDDHLRAAMSSLACQTHPCRAILCFDQAPGTEIRRALAAHAQYEMVPSPAGPYVPRQHFLMRSTARYLAFQDSDDVSLPDRIARLIAFAEDEAADLVGCHELRCDETTRTVRAVRFPLDVNAALRFAAGAAQLFPTTVARVATVRAAGGFSTERTFGADKQFHLRNYRRLRMRNLDAFLYIRRLRAGSLTTSAETGMASAARREVTQSWRRAFQDVKDGLIAIDDSALAIAHTSAGFHLRDLANGGLVPAELEPGRGAGVTR